MRTVDPILKTAYEKGEGIAIAKVIIQPFNLPESIIDLGAIDAADQADSGNTYIIRVRKNGAAVQINRFLRSGYTTVANWNSWTTLFTDSATITQIAIFIYTGAGVARTHIVWTKTGDTNIYGIRSADEGTTWEAKETTVTSPNTVTLLKGVHNGGFLWRDLADAKLWLHAYRGVVPAWIVNQIPTPDTAADVWSVKGSKRTINVNGANTDVITVAIASGQDTLPEKKLWIGSAINYLTAPTWTSAVVLSSQAASYIQEVRAVFDDYIFFQGTSFATCCKLLDHYSITFGYLGSRGVAAAGGEICGYDSTETKIIYTDGSYSTITGADIDYTVLEYHSTRESMQCRVTGTTPPVDGLLIASRGYQVEGEEYYIPLTPYRIQSWRTNPDRTFTIQAVTGYMALQGRDLPIGMQINTTRAQTLRLCFGVVGISCTPNSEALINAIPFPNAAPTITTLSAAVTRQNNAGSLELWNTEYGLRAIATQTTSSTQTLTPDGGLLPHKDYSQVIGLLASYLDSGFNVVDRAIEGDGGYPFLPYIHNFAYNPATYDEDLIENLHEERQHLGFFGTRANMSLETGDVVTIVASLIRIVDIIESFPTMIQEIRYRWHTEPLSLGDYGITPTQSSSSEIAIAPIQGHTHSGSLDVAAAIHAATEKNPPIDADEFGTWDSVSTFLRKITWANIKAAIKEYIGAFLNDSDQSGILVGYGGGLLAFDVWSVSDEHYALISKGVDNGNSHNHVNGDGAALKYTIILSTHGNNGTIAAGATMFTPVFIPGLSAAALVFTVDRAGTLKLLSMWNNSAQPATGSLVVTVMKNGVASALTLTYVNADGVVYKQDTTNTVSLVAGDYISIRHVNNAATASAQINGLTLAFEMSTT